MEKRPQDEKTANKNDTKQGHGNPSQGGQWANKGKNEQQHPGQDQKHGINKGPGSR